ncbi:uncharacterized protein LOC128204404 [Mya arenaria]|uniref:uncharacterized protein LOC128204404 n=1 Tax=Mya arenaria TaxID=6604 RepID=UPI0022DEDBF6|nr:uncharacterized protein LOC128204404 [Mya arenaria]
MQGYCTLDKQDYRGEQLPTRYVPTMEFEVDKRDYSVAEFYETFQDNLTRIVMVSQGFYGEITEDTFDREMIIRIQTVSKQQRVIALSEYLNHTKLISIPTVHPEKMCVVNKHNKLSKEKTMSAILSEYPLPVCVEFPGDRTIHVDGQQISTNHLPRLELLQKFDEMFLLGNIITDGVMDPDVIHVPLYLSQLRLALVTGIKGVVKQKWASYQEELDNASSYIEYDLTFGNQGIAQYDPSAVHSGSLYSYVEPRVYSNLANVFQTPYVSPHETVSAIVNPAYSGDNNDGDAGKLLGTEGTVCDGIGNQRANVPPFSTFKGKPTPPSEPNAKDSLQTVHKGKESPKVTRGIAAELKNALQARQHTSAEPDQSPTDTSASGKGPPTAELKPMRPLPAIPEVDAKETWKIPERLQSRSVTKIPPTRPHTVAEYVALYSNDVPRTSIAPMQAHVEKKQTTPATTHHKTENIKLVRPHKTASGLKSIQQDESLPEVNSPDDVKKLKISEVCEYLKVLRLENYADVFQNNLIDGMALSTLSRDDIQQEFQMKPLEAMRLTNFAQKGHVPQ